MRWKIENWLFNGYVREPIPIAFLILVVGLSLLALGIWGICDYFQPADLQSSRTADFIITEYEDDGPICVLYSDGKLCLWLPTSIAKSGSSVEWLIKARIPVKAKYTVQNIDATGTISGSLISLATEDGRDIFTEEEITQANQKNGQQALFVLWTVCAGYWLFAGISYYIVCNAPRYPHLAAVIIRKNYRNF